MLSINESGLVCEETKDEIIALLTTTSVSKVMKAVDVPIGGIFKFKGETYFRSSGEGRKTGDKLVKTKRPCFGVNLESGDVVGLDKAKVAYYPDAQLSL